MNVLFSCKITSSVLTYLERQGEDVTPLLEDTSLPEEFLKDPSYWMNAQEMEKFLSMALKLQLKQPEDFLLQKIAHATPGLRSWGVFDSVLRMMSLQDVLAQPSRFLSYFISPEPPVDNIHRTENSITLDVPVPSDQFPLTTSYLKSSFETLPVFAGKNLALCQWSGMRLKIEWEQDQNNIFSDKEMGHQISPELMRDIVAQLEKHQLELQQKNADLEARNEQLRHAYLELEAEMKRKMTLDKVITNPIGNYDFIEDGSVQILKNQIARLGDYMVRAQQLMTLLIGANRLNPGLKEAMKRVDWEWVKQQYPLTMATCFEILNRTEEKNRNTEFTGEKSCQKSSPSQLEKF